jgi:hypothetical protein
MKLATNTVGVALAWSSVRYLTGAAGTCWWITRSPHRTISSTITEEDWDDAPSRLVSKL